MKKNISGLNAVIKLLFLSVFLYLTFLVYVELFTKGTYRRTDTLEYYFLTPSEIKYAPIVSEDYSYSYHDILDKDEYIESGITYCKISQFTEAYLTLGKYADSLGIPSTDSYPEETQPEKFFLLTESRVSGDRCLSFTLYIPK